MSNMEIVCIVHPNAEASFTFSEYTVIKYRTKRGMVQLGRGDNHDVAWSNAKNYLFRGSYGEYLLMYLIT